MCNDFLDLITKYTTDDARNLMSVFFYMIMAILGILTYRQAKKGLFNPQKTEILKIQIKELADVLEAFTLEVNNDRFTMIDLWGTTDLCSNKQVGWIMQKVVQDITFKNKTPFTKEIQDLNNEIQSLIQNAMENTAGIAVPLGSKSPLIKLKDEFYSAYHILPLTEKSNEKINKLRAFSVSPVLSEKLRNYINQYIYEIRTQQLITLECMYETSQLMIGKYQEISEILHFINVVKYWHRDEVNKLLNERLERAEINRIGNLIISEIRTHLKIEELMS